MVKIAGCAGHAGFGFTAGKRDPDGRFEWDYNNKVIVAFEQEINKYENVQFMRFDDRTGRRDVPLKERTDKANSWDADCYLSFHHNALAGAWGSHGGTETYTYGQGKSLELGKVTHSAMVNAYGLRNRGLKTANLHIIRETKMPAVLFEGGFMDSTTDIHKLRDDNVLRQAGIGVAKAVAKFYGLTLKPVPVPPKQAATDVLYRVVTGSFGDRDNADRRIAELKKAGFESFIVTEKK